eukprot:4852518-Pleurochrysis_carterae.AAC.1
MRGSPYLYIRVRFICIRRSGGVQLTGVPGCVGTVLTRLISLRGGSAPRPTPGEVITTTSGLATC